MPKTDPLKQLALQHHQQGDLNKAKALYISYLQQIPDDVDVLNMLATLEASQNNHQSALEHLNQAIKCEQNYGYLYFSKALILIQTQQIESAVSNLEKAIVLEPTLFRAQRILANLYQQQELFYKAIEILLNYQTNNSNETEIDVELGYCFQKTGQLNLAIKHYQKTLSGQQNADVYFNLGMCQTLNFNWQLAEKNLLLAVKIQPNNLKFKCWILYIKKLNCKWTNYNEERERLSEEIAHSECKNLNELPPGYLLNVLGISDQLHAKAITWMHQISNFPKQKIHKIKTHSNRKINIGYLSPDFRNHAVGMLLSPVIKHHDKSQFKLFGYSLRETGDELNLKFKQEITHYHDVSKLTNQQIAEKIAADEIDILVDLAGLTDGSRPEVLGYHAAPIQLGLWGYLNSIGGDLWDYIITDKMIWPKLASGYYTEKPLFLDRSVLSSAIEFSATSSNTTKTQYGFPEDATVVGSFNNSYKITEEWFMGWLSAIEANSNLWFWIYAPEPHIKQQLQQRAQLRLKDCSRIIFADKVDYPEHLKRMTVVDLFADSFDYNAGASATAAILAGVPILTVVGETMLGRMGASINSDLEMPELICDTPKEYWNVASDLIKNPKKITKLKIKLIQNIKNKNFGNAKEFCNSLESVFIQVFKKIKS